MPPPIEAVVNWTEGKGQVGTITVTMGNGATMIRWTCGSDVARFEIKDLDETEFTPSHSKGQVPTFTTTDRADRAGDYGYTVVAVQKSTGQISTHDPKIENVP